MLLVPSGVRAMFIELTQGAVRAMRALAVEALWVGAVGGSFRVARSAERVMDTLVVEFSA